MQNNKKNVLSKTFSLNTISKWKINVLEKYVIR